jgi:hypothetical protein
MNGIFYSPRSEFPIIAVFGQRLEEVCHILNGGLFGRRRLVKWACSSILEIAGHF